jgi:hypothetical protein
MEYCNWQPFLNNIEFLLNIYSFIILYNIKNLNTLHKFYDFIVYDVYQKLKEQIFDIRTIK